MNSERLGTDEKRGVYASALAIGGHIYELYLTYPLSEPRTDVGGAPQLPDVRRLDSAAIEVPSSGSRRSREARCSWSDRPMPSRSRLDAA